MKNTHKGKTLLNIVKPISSDLRNCESDAVAIFSSTVETPKNSGHSVNAVAGFSPANLDNFARDVRMAQS